VDIIDFYHFYNYFFAFTIMIKIDFSILKMEDQVSQANLYYFHRYYCLLVFFLTFLMHSFAFKTLESYSNNL